MDQMVRHSHADKSGGRIVRQTAQPKVPVQDKKVPVLARLWRKGTSSTLLVGMQIGAATVENSMEFTQKTKNGIAL